MRAVYERLAADPSFRAMRLKNKLRELRPPFNLHLNLELSYPTGPPVLVEVQLQLAELSPLEDWPLADSGSALNACPVDYAPEYPLEASLAFTAQSASGHDVHSRGVKNVRYEFLDANGSSGGDTGEIRWDAMDKLSKPVLSVAKLNDRGIAALFRPKKACLERHDGSALALRRCRFGAND